MRCLAKKLYADTHAHIHNYMPDQHQKPKTKDTTKPPKRTSQHKPLSLWPFAGWKSHPTQVWALLPAGDAADVYNISTAALHLLTTSGSDDVPACDWTFEVVPFQDKQGNFGILLKSDDSQYSAGSVGHAFAVVRCRHKKDKAEKYVPVYRPASTKAGMRIEGSEPDWWFPCEGIFVSKADFGTLEEKELNLLAVAWELNMQVSPHWDTQVMKSHMTAFRPAYAATFDLKNDCLALFQHSRYCCAMNLHACLWMEQQQKGVDWGSSPAVQRTSDRHCVNDYIMQDSCRPAERFGLGTAEVERYYQQISAANQQFFGTDYNNDLLWYWYACLSSYLGHPQYATTRLQKIQKLLKKKAVYGAVSGAAGKAEQKTGTPPNVIASEIAELLDLAKKDSSSKAASLSKHPKTASSNLAKNPSLGASIPAKKPSSDISGKKAPPSHRGLRSLDVQSVEGGCAGQQGLSEVATAVRQLFAHAPAASVEAAVRHLSEAYIFTGEDVAGLSAADWDRLRLPVALVAVLTRHFAGKAQSSDAVRICCDSLDFQLRLDAEGRADVKTIRCRLGLEEGFYLADSQGVVVPVHAVRPGEKLTCVRKTVAPETISNSPI